MTGGSAGFEVFCAESRVTILMLPARKIAIAMSVFFFIGFMGLLSPTGMDEVTTFDKRLAG
jgi:hypothetical protein